MQFADIIVAVLVMLGVLLNLAVLPRIFQTLGFGLPSCRNLGHAGSFLVFALGVWFFSSPWALILLISFAVVFLIFAVELGWFPGVLLGKRKRDYGLVASGFAILLLAIFFFHTKEILIAALLVVGLADPLGAATGRCLGRVQIKAWGGVRTLEGTIAFAAATFTISLIFFSLQGGLGWNAVVFSLFVAFTAAIVELVSPSAVDNITVPLWVASMLLLISGEASVAPAALVAAMGAGILSAVASLQLRWLDPAGAVTAALVCTVALAFGGWAWLVPLLVFFAVGSVLTYLGKRQSESHGRRGLQQVLVNGLVPLLPVFPYAVSGDSKWYLLYVAGVAVACADTCATEIGRYSKKKPVYLRTLKRVRPGRSGAVSLLGATASIAGGGLIAVTALPFVTGEWKVPVFFAGLIIGPGGAAFDSVIGAWLQRQYTCCSCGVVCDKTVHCDGETKPSSGIPGLNNDGVNLLANLFGMLVAAQVLAYI